MKGTSFRSNWTDLSLKCIKTKWLLRISPQALRYKLDRDQDLIIKSLLSKRRLTLPIDVLFKDPEIEVAT